MKEFKGIAATRSEYCKQIRSMNKEGLLLIAKTFGIIGRHKMNKDQLCDAIIKVTKQPLAEAVDVYVEDICQNVATDLDFDTAVLRQLKEESSGSESDFGTTRIKRPKSEYIDNMTTGAIVAFKVNEAKVISGKVLKHDDDKLEFTIETKNGIRFMVKRKNIIWVKVGDKWPKGVYDLLVGGGKSYASAKEA